LANVRIKLCVSKLVDTVHSKLVSAPTNKVIFTSKLKEVMIITKEEVIDRTSVLVLNVLPFTQNSEENSISSYILSSQYRLIGFTSGSIKKK
jgi:hypothetical protein